MNKIIITKKARISKNRTCPCCGFNTNLLPFGEVVERNEEFYCKGCADADNKMLFTQSDFYKLWSDHTKRPGYQDEHLKTTIMLNKSNPPSIEIAHLCGEKYSGYVYLDMYYSFEEQVVCFRACCSDDDSDDPWDQTELVDYWSADDVAKMLNINDIHFFDGLTNENIAKILFFE